MKTKYTIAELEAKIAASDNKYAIRDMKDQLSWMKAEEKGQYVTVEHLKEYRNLIIFMINKASFFRRADLVKKAMEVLLERVNNNQYVYRTEKGIKGIICSASIDAAKTVCSDILTQEEGSEIWTNSNLRAEGTTYARMQSFYLNLAMGR